MAFELKNEIFYLIYYKATDNHVESVRYIFDYFRKIQIDLVKVLNFHIITFF